MPKGKNTWLTVLWAGLIAGYLDITFAIINFMFYSDKSPVVIFQYISSAAFGKERAYSKPSMITWGVLFHFLVAYSFTVFFFLVYPRLRFLAKSRLLTAILYGAFVWAVMNLLVVPNTYIANYPPWNYKTFVQALILMAAIGTPLSYIAYWHFYQRNRAK